MQSTVITVPLAGWAAKVFPDVSSESQEAQMWEAIFECCRVGQDDPVSAWQAHMDQLVARNRYLNQRQYAALSMSAPGTDLSIGLPDGHVWFCARFTSPTGLPYVCNLPTEELGTMPHKDKVEGIVTATKPLSYGGTLIEDFSLTFAGGRVVKATARKGEESLQRLLETDEGASRLGEVALVPHSSPISQTGRLFYNILFDENAANHLGLGTAYRFGLDGGQAMSEDEFAAAGGNQSMIHVDLMVGSGEMDVDGITKDGIAEPLMRDGEWAFEL